MEKISSTRLNMLPEKWCREESITPDKQILSSAQVSARTLERYSLENQFTLFGLTNEYVSVKQDSTPRSGMTGSGEAMLNSIAHAKVDASEIPWRERKNSVMTGEKSKGIPQTSLPSSFSDSDGQSQKDSPSVINESRQNSDVRSIDCHYRGANFGNHKQVFHIVFQNCKM